MKLSFAINVQTELFYSYGICFINNSLSTTVSEKSDHKKTHKLQSRCFLILRSWEGSSYKTLFLIQLNFI